MPAIRKRIYSGQLEAAGYKHPTFGDLNHPRAVILPAVGGYPAYREESPATIHLTVTGRCQARCKGCINSAVTNPSPATPFHSSPLADTDPNRDGAAIVNLLARSPGREAVICFYGGEPLLRPDLVMEVMDRVDGARTGPPVKYMLYTNGDLLSRVAAEQPELLRRLWLLSVSIDGRRDQHESIRLGTSLTRIRQGLAEVAILGKPTVLMWSTLREEQSLADCFAEFSTLHRQGLADQFFWHWVETSEPFSSFDRYLIDYEQDFRAVLGSYLESLSQGNILPITHLNELVCFILTGRRRCSSGCGVELADNYDLLGGMIHACADLPPELAIGTIESDGSLRFRSHDLMQLVEYKADLGCPGCGVHAYCGGRCPVQARIGSPMRLNQYCQLMRLHVGLVLKRLPEIETSLRHHGISAQQLYDRSARYNAFTDVTP